MPIMCYGFGILNWTLMEIKLLDRKQEKSSHNINFIIQNQTFIVSTNQAKWEGEVY